MFRKERHPCSLSLFMSWTLPFDVDMVYVLSVSSSSSSVLRVRPLRLGRSGGIERNGLNRKLN